MPPRFAYWTILIDNRPTAFRARDQQELLPTLAQLKRTNQDVVMKWFAQGRLWDSPEAQRESWKKPKAPPERRGRDWRPGGDHKDPRARFDKDAQRRKRREMRAERDKLGAPSPGGKRPWSNPPRDRDAARRGRDGRRPAAPRNDRPWQTKPTGPRADRKPWQHQPTGPPRGDRPWSGKPRGADGGAWRNKPAGARPDRKPWQNKPAGERPSKPFQPRGPQSGATPGNQRRRRRDDEPPDRD